MTYSAIDSFERRVNSRPLSIRRLMPVLLSSVALLAGPAAWAVSSTTTSLFTTPQNPSSGAVITMTAQVSSTQYTVGGGTVTFTDKYNNVTEVLGTVQVQSAASGNAGTAVLETEVGGVGQHQFVATFSATSSFSSSASSVQSVTFIAPYLSATALTSTSTSPYTFTSTVSAFGPSAPTGSVTFTDTTSNYTLGTVGLNSSSLMTGFAPYTSYPISNINNGKTGGTNAPAIGDFNGDGRLDYAVPTNAGPIIIFLGKGDGTFTSGTTITSQSSFTPTSIVVGDFNGDGKQDLGVLSSTGGGVGGNSGSVDIYLGNGNGTFQTYKNYLVSPTVGTAGSRILAVGDFNRDGYQDLVATNTSLNTVAVILGNGDGTFGSPSYNVVGSLPWNVVVGDLNNDGYLDLVTAQDGSSSVSVLQGNGDGTFKTYTTFNTSGSQVGSVAIGDFNGDGWIDIASTSAQNNNAYILLNTKAATPTFAAAVSYPITPGPYYLTVGDFNRDGKPDLIAATNGTNATSVAVLLGTGSGSFNAATYYSVGGASYFANAADINGDDQVDLTALTSTGISVLLSGEAETAVLSNTPIYGCGTQSVTAAYGGDSNYGQSTSAALTFTPTKQTTTLSLTAMPQTVVTGQQFTLTATLSPYNYGSTTTNGETVTFYANGTAAATANLVNGVATFNYTSNSTGSANITASYPGDCGFAASNSPSSGVTVTVLQASTLSWSNPAAITYGTPLSATQLNATDSVAGTFAYTPAAGTVLSAGSHTLSVTFTPTSSSYGQETTTVTIQVNQEGTVITWPTPTPITYGTPLSGFQLDATASTGTISVPLSSYYNVYGIYDPGMSYTTGGFDNDGYSYSSKTLSNPVLFGGLTYTIGPANAVDAVYGTGTPIPLPAGNFTGLYFLGAMVNNISPTQTFTVTYTDGTTTTLTQKMSDWFNAAGWPGESVVNCSEKRNYDNGSQQSDSVCVYGYSIALDSTRIVQSITLPSNRNILVLSMDLTTPNVPGTFTYTPPAGTVEPVGTDTLSVTFTPTDTTDYQTSTATVNLVVTNAVTPIVTPTISWPNPANITYGTPLSATQLDAVAMGTPRPTPVTPTSQLVPIATSTDGTSYNLNGFDGNGNTYSYKQLNNGSVQFAGTTFTLGQPNVPDSITNGATYTLGNAQGNYSTLYLIGAATTTGETAQPFILTYNDSGNPVTETLDMSSWAQSAGYSDESIIASTTYANTQSGGEKSGTYDLYGYTLAVDPTRTLVSVSVPNTRNVVIMALGFGSNNQVVVPGTYVYNPTSGTVLSIGTHTLNVTFTPTNTQGYTTATDSVPITVVKATPVITWPTPNAIAPGTPLSSTQLDATASINGTSLPGTYSYNPAAGTTFTAGTYTLNVTFTPTDTTDYNVATGSVQIVVGVSTSLGGAPVYETGDCCFFSQPTPYVVTVGGATIAPTGTLSVTFNGQTLASGTLVAGSGANSTVSLNVNSIYFVPGSNTVALNYGGDTNYEPSTNTAVIQLRNPAILSNPTSVGGGSATEIIPYTYVVAGSITFNFNPSGGSISDFTNTSNSTCSSGTQEPAGFICTFNVAYAPTLPGIRKGVVQVNFTDSSNNAEPTLYLYLSGLGDAAQISLGSGSQTVLSSGLNQPQGLTFKPTDTNNSTLYVANSNLKVIDTIPATGGSLTQWNSANTKNLVYPSDLVFDAFGNLIVSDANVPGVFSFNNSLAESTVGTGSYTVGMPTAVRLDLAGNLYIADAGNTPRILEVSGESGDTTYLPSVLLTGSNVSFPQSLAVDNSGSYLYVGDGNLNTVTQVTLSTGAVSTVNISPCDSTVTSCAFNSPAGMTFDPNGDMFITDSGQRVLVVPANHSSGGKTTQLPITGLNNPSAVALDGSGNVYVTDLNTSVTKWQANSGALTINPLNAAVTTTITNTGNLNLNITALTFGNGSNSSFTETDTCVGNAVAPGGTCSITITYSNSAGAATDTLTIASNAFSATGVTIKLTN